MNRSAIPGMAVASAVLVAGLLLALMVGRYPVSFAELFGVIAGKLTGHAPAVPSAVENVVWQVRGPRVASAALVGAALAIAGTAFQGLFRNPLVSPDILGASSGAALGAVLGIYFSLGVFAIQAFAFVGGLVAVAAVYVIGGAVRARDPILVLVLTGVVIGASIGARDIAPLGVPVALGTLLLLALRWRLNVMSLPDEEARALGLPTGPLRVAIVAAATLVTSASVATAGIIGWVGLVVPHIARTLVGPDFGRLIPAAALIGGGFLLLIDTLARTAAAVEIPLGILTALVGTPFFIWLLASMSKTWSVE